MANDCFFDSSNKYLQPAVADYQGPFWYNTTGEAKKGIAGLAAFFGQQWGEA